jgi:hypothetical protein
VDDSDMINNLFGPGSSGGGDVLGGFGNLSIGVGGGSGGFASSLAGWASSTPTEHTKDNNTSSDQRGIGLGGVVLGPDPSSSNFGQPPQQTQQNSHVSEPDQHHQTLY